MIRKQINVIILLVGIFTLIVFLWNRMDTVQTNASVSDKSFLLSKESGFYDEDITIYAQGDVPGEIYYTLDGSEPVKDNEAAKLLTVQGISIPCNDEEAVYNVKCRAYYDDGSVSETVCRSFITGKNISTRYDLPVLSVFGDPKDFYDYETGILVHGKLDDEYIAEHYDQIEEIEAKLIPVYGNRYQKGRESEKEVYITLFDEQGTVMFSQNGGFRLFGGFSRSKNQPSFKLYARSEYDTLNEFDFTLFEDQYNDDDSVLVGKFKRLVVRNNGNDNGYAFLRNELSLKLALDAGFPDAQASRPVCVYLNGEYYGILWLMTNYDDEYFKQTYGEYEGSMFVYEGSVDDLVVDEEKEDAAYIQLAEEYEKKQAYFAECDLSDESNWNDLNAFMDVENFLQYTAIQHYVANWDTMVNNYKIYRYFDPAGNYKENSVFDGRYRFLLFDLDYSLGMIEYAHYVEATAARLTAERVKGEEEHFKLFANLMKLQECREIYMRYFLSAMNYYYSASYVNPILDQMHGERYQELNYAISQGLYVNNFCAEDVTEMAAVEKELEEIRQFLKDRPAQAFYDLVLAFGTLTPYTLNLQNEFQATVQIDYADVTAASLSGIYLAELPPVIKARAKVGEKFSHWIVNGEIITEEELIIEESMIKDFVVNITCICEADEEIGIKISMIRSKGGQDYVVLTNFGKETKSLREYALSDSLGERKSPLPDRLLAPGESVTVYCKNYTGLESLGQIGLNFNIKTGETISLYRNEELMETVTVPDLGSRDNVYALDMQTGRFKEIIP